MLLLPLYMLLAFSACKVKSCVNCPTTFKSCKEVKEAIPWAPSGIYYLTYNNSSFEVYCEMFINGGGWTFLSWSTINANKCIINQLFTDKSKIVFRLLGKANKNVQPYVVTSQLKNAHVDYKNIPISVQVNSYVGYKQPLNNQAPIANSNFVYIGFVPNITAATPTTQGFTANGCSMEFKNCDLNGNSYFALFPNAVNTSNYLFNYENILATWRSKAVSHPLCTVLPESYFYFVEQHMGGCGGYSQSNRWNDYSGIAFGLK